ncbi:hypothetical protein [Methanococcoides sp. AM1]|uniref:hypothetical protein n=1 Tax=Methanococcoides sp. AM1 TaxID=1201011 RepID=UPI0014383122|nr:hypothetical protein [Methanococcoides sp. AM1]
MGQIADLTLGYYGYDMYNSPFPIAEYTWMIAIIAIALLAIWKARTFASKF